MIPSTVILGRNIGSRQVGVYVLSFSTSSVGCSLGNYSKECLDKPEEN